MVAVCLGWQNNSFRSCINYQLTLLAGSCSAWHSVGSEYRPRQSTSPSTVFLSPSIPGPSLYDNGIRMD